MIGKAVLVLILAVAVLIPLYMVKKLGLFRSFHKHHPGTCRQISGIDYGSEDLAVTTTGLAFISSGFLAPLSQDGYKHFYKEKNLTGKVYLFDFNAIDQGAVELKVKAHPGFEPSEFHPHGLSLLEDSTEKGEHLLYVISHPNMAADHVIKFRFLPKGRELEFVKSFSSDKFYMTNDLAVLEEDVFYVSNSLYFNSPSLVKMELLLGLGLGGVVLYNGTDAVEVSPGIDSANGITLSKDGRYLYVASTTLGNILVFELRPDKSLKPAHTIPLDTGLDNLHLSPTGQGLFIGAQPVAWKLFFHLEDPKAQTPSSVLYMPLHDGKARPEDVVEVFYDHGDLISGSSVAASYNNHLLIGSVIDKLVLCQINVPPLEEEDESDNAAV